MKTSLKDPLLIYHANCPDGFGAAYSFWLKFGDQIEYIAANHYDEIPDVDDRDVYFADICLDKEKMLEINERAKSLQVLDHHKSAQKEMEDYDFCHFDMERSGSVLAWNFCFPDEEAPLMLRYIQDRDLWEKRMPYSDEVLSVLDSTKMTFEEWNMFKEKIEKPEGYSETIREGRVILQYIKTLMCRIKESSFRINIKGYDVPVINTPFFRTEIVSELSEGEPFAAGFHYDGESYIFSLRSEMSNDHVGLDVSEIASSFPGGGGHPGAAGFSIKTLDDLE